MRFSLPDGLETELRAWGDGDQSVLCLHPLGQEAAYFGDLAAALGPGWRVVAYDQRGHGAAAGQPAKSFKQMVDDAEAALRQCGASHVAGFSMGGAIASELARRRPPRTLTLAATPHKGLPVFVERARAVREGSVEAVAEGTLARWFGDAAYEPAAERARASLLRLSPEGFDAAWRAFATFEGYEERAVALPPTLCLAYGNDLSTPPDVLDAIARAIRAGGGTAERETIPGAGHMGLLQKPAETAAAIARFVERHA